MTPAEVALPRWVHINDRRCNCPIRAIPDHRADQGNTTISEIANPQLWVYPVLLLGGYTQLHCSLATQRSFVWGSYIGCLGLPLSTLCLLPGRVEGRGTLRHFGDYVGACVNAEMGGEGWERPGEGFLVTVAVLWLLCIYLYWSSAAR